MVLHIMMLLPITNYEVLLKVFQFELDMLYQARIEILSLTLGTKLLICKTIIEPIITYSI